MLLSPGLTPVICIVRDCCKDFLLVAEESKWQKCLRIDNYNVLLVIIEGRTNTVLQINAKQCKHTLLLH